MRIRGISVFLSAFVLATALLLAQSAVAIEPGLVTPEEGKTLVQQKKDLFILDVRNPNEYVVAHYPGAVNIPVSDLEARIAEVPTDRPVLVYCAKGRRAARSYELLKAKRPEIKELYCINGDTIF